MFTASISGLVLAPWMSSDSEYSSSCLLHIYIYILRIYSEIKFKKIKNNGSCQSAWNSS